MGVSSDIANLFKQFGGRPDHYQEIASKDDSRASVERWPTVARGEVSVKSPSPFAVAAASQAQAVEGNPSVPGTTEAPAPQPQQASAWSPEGLQSLLAKLAEETREHEAQEAEAAALQQARPRLEHVRVIAVVSAKGGVGKSTMAASLAAALRKAGRAVLALDLDPQNALHHHFQFADERPAVVAGLSGAEQDWRELCAASRDGVCVLPYGQIDEPGRRAFEQRLDDDPLWLARRLADLQLAEGAVVLIDTPPGPSLYLQQALSVANLALVVSLADAASYTALPMIDGLIADYAQGRADFFGATYLINQVDNSRQLSKDITRIMQGLLGQRLLGLVHRDQSIGEALAYNRTILDFDPHGRGCHDILECAQGLVTRLATDSRAEQPA
ncbi:cellulose biosynthesis protein BcsQ [Pseudomonas sp. CAU 1711]|uniref:cellulose biosynthesis protein BcsQ n=1 Tax=Pseudomonas sp. CAU 1711 TaxID=3140356 RepID=UPI0032608CA4